MGPKRTSLSRQPIILSPVLSTPPNRTLHVIKFTMTGRKQFTWKMECSPRNVEPNVMVNRTVRNSTSGIRTIRTTVAPFSVP